MILENRVATRKGRNNFTSGNRAHFLKFNLAHHPMNDKFLTRAVLIG